jgi:hypothetical protein
MIRLLAVVAMDPIARPAVETRAVQTSTGIRLGRSAAQRQAEVAAQRRRLPCGHHSLKSSSTVGPGDRRESCSSARAGAGGALAAIEMRADHRRAIIGCRNADHGATRFLP